MFRPLKLVSIVLLFLSSCKNNSGHTYAIKDFRESLRPHLTKVVSTGIVMHQDSALKHISSDKELMQLTKSEHPVLRASAFREILNRKSFNQYETIISHLDDTATVAVDMGEFGIWNRKVSDDILENTTWKSQDEKNKAIDEVLTKHNYLRAAYIILPKIKPQEKYYLFIKDMATRPRRLSDDGYELDFDDIEYALYGLAKFKKEEDIKIIKEQLLRYAWQISHLSFRLMKEFPDPSYMEIFKSYYESEFYNFTGHRRNGFTGYPTRRADPEDFINALVAQQTRESARLLDTVLSNIKLDLCFPDRENIEEAIVMAIWNNSIPAYEALRTKIKPQAEAIEKNIRSIRIERNKYPIDTTTEVFGWYP